MRGKRWKRWFRNGEIVLESEYQVCLLRNLIYIMALAWISQKKMGKYHKIKKIDLILTLGRGYQGKYS